MLTNLIGSPNEVGEDFKCGYNKLETLQGLSGEIGGDLACNDNLLTSLDTVSNIKGNINCWDNLFDETNHNFTGWCDGYIFCKFEVSNY